METEREKVLRANQSFYRAFEDCDLGLMREVWSREPYARCSHPGWKTLFGWASIGQSWEGIFSNPTMMRFELHDVHVDVLSEIAIVSLVEEITAVRAEGTSKSRVVVTNVFENRDDRWQMILHHGSPYSFPERTSRYN